MITDIISEQDLSQKMALWMLEYDRGTLLPLNTTKDEFCLDFAIPDVNLVHTQTYLDKDGNAITLLKGEISLTASQSRSGKAEKFVFYKVLKTAGDYDPVCIGYIAV